MDMVVRQRREPLEVVRIDRHPGSPKLIQRQPDVASVPHHDRIQYQAKRAELILLTRAIRLMQLASATVEHTPGQAMTTFTRVDLNQQATPVSFVIHQIEKVECFADAPILGQRPRQAGVTAAALKGLHQIVTSDYTKFERAGHTQKIVPMASNEVGVDAMASHAIEGPVVGGLIDAIEAGVAEIRKPWAEAITKQHEQTKDDVRIRCRICDQGRRLQRGVLLEQSVENNHR